MKKPAKNSSHIKFVSILKLLDDDSTVVQEAVDQELKALGHTIQDKLSELPELPPIEVRKDLQKRIEKYNRTWLLGVWPHWFDIACEAKKLEAALSLLSSFQSGAIYPVRLTDLLDDLVFEYKATHSDHNVYNLATFLFRTKGLKGAGDDYNNPLNSDLVYVIREKKGIPISLSCIYILAAKRVGLSVDGCNYPGHFFAKATLKDQTFYVDCYNRGHFLDEKDVLTKDSPSRVRETLHTRADTLSIIRRVLHNLYNAYKRDKLEENCILFNRLKNMLEERQNQTSASHKA